MECAGLSAPEPNHFGSPNTRANTQEWLRRFQAGIFHRIVPLINAKIDEFFAILALNSLFLNKIIPQYGL